MDHFESALFEEGPEPLVELVDVRGEDGDAPDIGGVKRPRHSR